MRAYKIQGETDDGTVVTRYAGSMADAKAAKKEISGNRRNGAAGIEEIEVPTGKIELIAFLNALVSP